MSLSDPEVSIVLPCRNESDHIESCIKSILAQELPEGRFELIVADGMSDDGTRNILKRLVEQDSRLQVVDNPGQIVSTGLNAGIRAARGNVIIRMDAHTEYATNYICQCLAVLQETGAANVGGPWVAKGKGLWGRAIATAFQSPFAIGGARGHDPSYEGSLDTVYLGCWPREIFDRVGFFDEELVRNQDDEFNLRLTRAGEQIWQSPRIKSWYTPRESLRALFLQYLQYGYWKVRVMQKHRMAASVRHLIPGLFVASLVILPLVAPFWPAAGRGWLGLVGLYGACNIAASIVVALRYDWKLLPFLPPVFASYHFGYGIGFLHGARDFLILHRRPDNTYTGLTRTSSKHST